MNALDKLKQVVQGQKTIRTTRLGELVADVEKMYIGQAQSINAQRNKLAENNKTIQRLRTTLDNKKASNSTTIDNYENLKAKHRRLKEEHSLLKEAHTNLKRRSSWDDGYSRNYSRS